MPDQIDDSSKKCAHTDEGLGLSSRSLPQLYRDFGLSGSDADKVLDAYAAEIRRGLYVDQSRR
jgi:hypothetical protein